MSLFTVVHYRTSAHNLGIQGHKFLDTLSHNIHLLLHLLKCLS